MSHNWNVYKIFKNGKRAKAPIHEFMYDDENTVMEYFETEVKKKFSEKIRGLEFSILRADMSQEREVEKQQEADEALHKQQKNILGRLVRAANVKTKRNITAALVYAKETNWSWQWCAAEAGTHTFLAPLSPQFKTNEQAHEWLNNQIS
tara:strand:- start:4580 stop:5026 length:447 start_codon:yes stop_codon:yes gene_type:complete